MVAVPLKTSANDEVIELIKEKLVDSVDNS